MNCLTLYKNIIFVSFLTLLVACGGGGSGGDAGSSATPQQTNTNVNNKPIANSGSDQNKTTNSVVNLDGSGSSDPDGDQISYDWTFVSIPNGSSVTLNDSTLPNPQFTPTIDGDYILSLVVSDSIENSDADTTLITSSIPSGSFDDFSGNGALIGYTVNNENSLPDVSRVNNRYRANLTNNSSNITLHYNAAQGRLDAKQATFPFEVIARNIGIGSQSNSQLTPSSPSSQYIFAGIQIHVLDLASRNSSHVVVGHRGSTSFTIEGKNTVNSNSSVNDEGANIAPLGRSDIRIIGNANRTLTVYWQQPNLNGGTDNWQLYRNTGQLPGTAPTYGARVYVGLITYAQGSAGLPFVGTSDSFQIID